MSDSILDAFEDGAATLGRDLREQADTAARHLNEGIARASEKLDDGREAVEEGITRARKRVDGATRRAARAVSDSGEYFRTNGPRGVMRDVEDLVREHPGKALMAVAAVGVLIGLGLKRRR